MKIARGIGAFVSGVLVLYIPVSVTGCRSNDDIVESRLEEERARFTKLERGDSDLASLGYRKLGYRSMGAPDQEVSIYYGPPKQVGRFTARRVVYWSRGRLMDGPAWVLEPTKSVKPTGSSGR